MKKFFSLTLTILILLVFSKTTFSQTTISVIGKGTTKEEALQDALRSAVEKATGVFIYSSTETKNFKLVQDKIVAASKGYVKDYKITDEKNYEGIIILTVEVTVDTESIKTILRQDLKAVTYDDVLKDYNLITQKMDKLKKSAELLKAITSRPITEMYNIDYVGYQIVDVGLEEIKINFLVRVALNPFFWDTYEKILEQISDEGEKGVACALYKFTGFYEKNNPSCKELIAKKYKIHPDLQKFLINYKTQKFKINLPKLPPYIFELGLFKNLINLGQKPSYSTLSNICETGSIVDSKCKYYGGWGLGVGFRFDFIIHNNQIISVYNSQSSATDQRILFDNEITFAIPVTTKNPDIVKYLTQGKIEVIK